MLGLPTVSANDRQHRPVRPDRRPPLGRLARKAPAAGQPRRLPPRKRPERHDRLPAPRQRLPLRRGRHGEARSCSAATRPTTSRHRPLQRPRRPTSPSACRRCSASPASPLPDPATRSFGSSRSGIYGGSAERREMSTGVVIAIVVVALIAIALLVTASRRTAQRKELGRVQAEAQHADVDHHRDRADERLATRPTWPRSRPSAPASRPTSTRSVPALVEELARRRRQSPARLVGRRRAERRVRPRRAGRRLPARRRSPALPARTWR